MSTVQRLQTIMNDTFGNDETTLKTLSNQRTNQQFTQKLKDEDIYKSSSPSLINTYYKCSSPNRPHPTIEFIVPQTWSDLYLRDSKKIRNEIAYWNQSYFGMVTVHENSKEGDWFQDNKNVQIVQRYRNRPMFDLSKPTCSFSAKSFVGNNQTNKNWNWGMNFKNKSTKTSYNENVWNRSWNKTEGIMFMKKAISKSNDEYNRFIKDMSKWIDKKKVEWKQLD